MFRATKIAGYLKAMKARGIHASQLLAGTRIDSKLLADPEYLISLEQYHAVVANMMKLTDDPGVAFSLADIANLNEIGIVGYAMISSTTLRQALDVWIKYSNTLVGTPIQVQSFHDRSPGYELVISSSSKVGVFNRFESEELLVQGMKLVRDLTGVTPVIGEVSLPIRSQNTSSDTRNIAIAQPDSMRPQRRSGCCLPIWTRQSRPKTKSCFVSAASTATRS